MTLCEWLTITYFPLLHPQTRGGSETPETAVYGYGTNRTTKLQKEKP